MADNTLTLDLINDILKGNLNAAENSLHQSLAVKQNDALDQEKIKMAGQIYNNVPAEEEDEDIEISDEELEDAIADEESEEEVENEEVDDESSEDEEDE
jgi:hypothetical protein